MRFEIGKFAFLYGDYEYFQWFRNKTKANLEKVIRWKKLRRGKPETNDIWSEKRKDLNESAIEKVPGSRVVTRAFLFHLRRPLEYPILDPNVFRAMKEIDEDNEYQTHKNIRDWKIDYLNGYKPFFEDFYRARQRKIRSIEMPSIDGFDEEIIKRRILDRALWEYGRTIAGCGDALLDC